MLGKTTTRPGRSERISVGRWRWLAVGFPYYKHRELLRETKAGRGEGFLLEPAISKHHGCIVFSQSFQVLEARSKFCDGIVVSILV